MSTKYLEKLSKEEYIKMMQNRIYMRDDLIKFIENVFFPVLKKFDGKVYNKRFINALNDEAKKISNLIFIRQKENGVIQIDRRKDPFSYLHYEFIIFRISIDNGRINYNNTFICVSDDIKSFNNRTKNYYDCIENYDYYFSIVEELDKASKRFRELPLFILENVNKRYILV